MSPATSVRETVILPWKEPLDWTYRLESCEITVRDDEVRCLDVGTVYTQRRDGRKDELKPRHFPEGFRGYLLRRAEQHLAGYAAEIERDIRDANERAQHQPACPHRGDFGSDDICNCRLSEERLGRTA